MTGKCPMVFALCLAIALCAVSTVEARGKKRREAPKEPTPEELQEKTKFTLDMPDEDEDEKTMDVSGSVRTKEKSGQTTNKVTQTGVSLDGTSSPPTKFTLDMKSSASLSPGQKQALSDFDSFFYFEPDQVSFASVFSEDDDGLFRPILAAPDTFLYNGSEMTFDFTIKAAYRPTGDFDIAQIVFPADWVGDLEYDVTIVTESGKTFHEIGTFEIPEPALVSLTAAGAVALLWRRRTKLPL
jgi:hypothetical protein